jgi:DNA primase
MAGRIPQSFIDDLLARTDIVGVIESRVPLKRAGRNYSACCPFHKEKSPSFTVSPDKQFYYCFGCGATGNAIGFLMDYEKRAFPEAVEELAGRAGLTVPHEQGEDDGAAQRLRALYAVLDDAEKFFREQLRHASTRDRAVDYLKGRGLTGEIARRYALGYAPPGWDNLLNALGKDETRRTQLVTLGLLIRRDERVYDGFRDRVMFPIRDLRGRVIAFGGRVIGDGKPKYLNSPESPVFHKGRELYGLHEAKQAARTLDMLIVVEGYMDVIALAQQGITGAVATLGTSCTGDHVDLLFRHTARVLFCFDGDNAGRRAAWRAIEATLPRLHDGREARVLFLPEGEDPDTLVRRIGPDAFRDLCAHAPGLDDALLAHLAEGIDLQRTDGRARLASLARPLLAQVPGEVMRALMTRKLADLAQVDIRLLEAPHPAVAAGHAPAGASAGASNSAVGRGQDHPPADYPPDYPDHYPGNGDFPDDYPAPPPDDFPAGAGQRRSARPGARPGTARRPGPPRRGPLPPAAQIVRRLLLAPELAHALRLPEDLAEIDEPGMDLLRACLAVLTESGQPSVAVLFGRLRGTPHEEALANLARLEFLEESLDGQAVQAALPREIDGALRQLELTWLDHRIGQELRRPEGPDRDRLNGLYARQMALKQALVDGGNPG